KILDKYFVFSSMTGRTNTIHFVLVILMKIRILAGTIMIPNYRTKKGVTLNKSYALSNSLIVSP
ncbi:hypothetical protein, partial [Vibrio breoganii]|uniref:hypothetical protein n=1 Tax=Vibrio breoganii TaxID=553239 RepID=UPI001A7E1389